MMNNHKNVLLALVAAALAICSVSAHAGTKWGVFDVTPSINLNYSATDNLYNTRTREHYDTLLEVTPAITLQTGNPILNFVADAYVAAGWYSRSGDDDYVDSHIGGAVTYQPTTRALLDVNASRDWGHDDRGTERSEGATTAATIPEPDEWTKDTFGAQFTYGAPAAKGQLILATDYTDTEYTNNRAFTRVRDYDNFGYAATFKWRVMPKTNLLAEGRFNEIEYDYTAPGTAELDSDEERYYVGVEWEATYKTTGSFRIGRLKKEFDDPTRKDISESSWEAGVDWKPKTYSTVTFTTGRTTGETNGTGDASLTDYYDLSWNHAWKDRFSTTVGYSYTEDEYTGSNREDELSTFVVSANYEMRRWLNISAGYAYEDKDSNIRQFDYDRNDIYINAAATF